MKNRTYTSAVLRLIAISILGLGCEQRSADSLLTPDRQTAGVANGQAIEPESEIDPPSPDSQGNYRAQQRRPVHPLWQVVDPEGLNCRMPQAFQWRDLGEPINPKPQWSTIGDVLWNDQRQNPLDWPVMTLLPPDTTVSAWGGNLGAMIVLDHSHNQPWLPVWVQDGNRKGHCFVRANQMVIRPVAGTDQNRQPEQT